MKTELIKTLFTYFKFVDFEKAYYGMKKDMENAL